MPVVKPWKGVAYLFRISVGREREEEKRKRALAPSLLGIAAYKRQRLKGLNRFKPNSKRIELKGLI